jgi:hypothetical protein
VTVTHLSYIRSFRGLNLGDLQISIIAKMKQQVLFVQQQSKMTGLSGYTM